MSDVTPRLKPEPEPCVCGCGLVGRPRVKAWGDGLGPHVRRCGCRRCVGGRQRAKATRRENRVAKRLGGQREPLSGQLSGMDGSNDWLEWEDTADKVVTRGLKRWVETDLFAAKTADLFGPRRVHSTKPKALILAWDGRPRWVVMRFEDLETLDRLWPDDEEERRFNDEQT